jgi:hypothetical protein
MAAPLKNVSLFQRTSTVCIAAILLAVAGTSASAEWKQDDKTLSWKAKPTDEKPAWNFSFDATKGKTFFEPLTVAGGPSFTNYKPVDHPWHYGLWFSWKYINHVNYWEEGNPTTGNAAGNTFGKTTWKMPAIVTKPDGSASIKYDVAYTNNKGEVDLSEVREITVTPVAADGSYAIDWKAVFTAGKDGAELDRTPMPGEPNGAVNGGYAGIGLRMASNPLVMNVTSTIGPITEFRSSRARPNAAAIGCNFLDAAKKDVGGIAIFSDPANTKGEPATWYIINDNTQNNGEGFRFACPSILAPKVIKLAAGEKMNLHYQFALSAKAWTPDTLKAEQERWIKAIVAK